MQTTTAGETRSAGEFSLTPGEVRQFHEQGFLPRFRLKSPEEMEPIRRTIGREVLGRPSAWPGEWTPGMCRFTQSRHLDSRPIWELCSDPRVVRRMASLLGRDLLLWRTNLWNKEPAGDDGPRSGEIPWHQDWFYWSMEPPMGVTAWLALDRTTRENSCVRVIPGSHKRAIPHVPVHGKSFQTGADPALFDESQAVDMELEAGEFFLFNERLLHGSLPNRSRSPRLGLAIRVTVPFVRIAPEEDFVFHPLMVLHGSDEMGFNELCAPPE
jgi:hypothetical protein